MAAILRPTRPSPQAVRSAQATRPRFGKSAPAGSSAANIDLFTDGYLGFWLKTTDPGLQVSIAVDDVEGTAERGLFRDVIPDGYQDKVRKAASGSINDAIEVMKSARPDLNHLREGGSEQEADLILGLMNFAADLRVEATAVQATTDHYEIGVLKNRYGPTGKWAELSYSGASGRIADVGATESADDVLARLSA